MEIQSTIPMKNVSFKAQPAKTQNQTANNTNPVKDGDKKLKYALGALAAAGVAAITIGAAIHHGKVTKAAQQAGETAQKAVEKTTQKAVQTAGQTASEAVEKTVEKAVEKTSEAASEAVEKTVEKAVEKEAAKAPAPAITASERHIQQQNLMDPLTGEKANKSAQNSASALEEIFDKIEEENAQKALEAATGKKSGIVADAGYQQMYRDLAKKQEEQALLDLVTGQKSGESAQAAASAFKHAPQNINDKIADICSYKGIDFVPNAKIEQKLRRMSPEALENLSHKDIMRLLETPKQPKATKVAINKLSQLER